ncbi:MAG: hypothetical protein ACOC1K_03965 [Nanoarchaeota archaeon]
MTEELTGKDILLLLLYLPGRNSEKNELIIGRTRLTKMIYIFNKEIKDKIDNLDESSLPEFFAYDYGPFSKELLDDIHFFVNIGFVEEDEEKYELTEADYEESKYDYNEEIGLGEVESLENDPPNIYSYKLTQKGINYVENNIVTSINEKQKKYLIQFKRKINSLSLDSILSYVYNKYPDAAENSLIKSNYINENGVEND